MVFRHLPRVPHYSVVINILNYYRHDRDSKPDRRGENQTCSPLHHGLTCPDSSVGRALDMLSEGRGFKFRSELRFKKRKLWFGGYMWGFHVQNGIYIHTYTCIHIHTYTRTRARTHTRKRAHTHTNTYIYIIYLLPMLNMLYYLFRSVTLGSLSNRKDVPNEDNKISLFDNVGDLFLRRGEYIIIYYPAYYPSYTRPQIYAHAPMCNFFRIWSEHHYDGHSILYGQSIIYRDFNLKHLLIFNLCYVLHIFVCFLCIFVQVRWQSRVN